MALGPDYRPAPKFQDLGPRFADEVSAADFPQTLLRFRNDRWAARVGLDGLSEAQWIDHFARFAPLPDNLPKPLAIKYHGHQFRTYNPDIGDGRGFLFAQVTDSADQRLLDLATKGSGRTPYSRSGDGRLTLKGGVREALATAMLEALGVYTSKTFSLIETGEQLDRSDEPSPTRSAVMVRLSHSHIRYGVFQRHAYFEDADAIATLIDYASAHYFPDLKGRAGDDLVVAFLEETVRRAARLVAQWMAAGFVHGVLNTDNMNITGESFDYGPYRFVFSADPNFTAAYFDHTGLYAYGRQPDAVGWNLAALAGALQVICPTDKLAEALKLYPDAYQAELCTALYRRLGIEPLGGDADLSFAQDLMTWLARRQSAFEAFFFDWFCGPASAERAMNGPRRIYYEAAEFAEVKARLTAAEPVRPDRLSDPYFKAQEPQTLLIDEIENIWAQIADADDWSAFEAKLAAIETARRALDL